MQVPFSTRIPEGYKEKLQLLNDLTRIPQTEFVKEAFDDLFKKYKDVLESH